MRILFDTNVVLDVLLNREPHSRPAARLFVHAERKQIDGLLGATTVTTIHYLARRALGADGARTQVQRLLGIFDVAPVGKAVLSDALMLPFRDYEDAVLHESARHAGAVGLVSRDAAGFKRATLRVYSPDELLRMVQVVDRGGSTTSL